MKKEKRIFSITDLIIVVLVATAVLSVVFHPYIQKFLGELDEAEAEYTFVVEYVSEQAMNMPLVGERMYSVGENDLIGTIDNIIEKSEQYSSEYGETVSFKTLQCTAHGTVVRTESGAMAGSSPLKSGAQIRVKTDTASFLITVLSVKIINK